MNRARRSVRPRSYLFAYAALAVILIAAHGPLLHLPYYWDEIGQFIPASLDLFQTGAWIPHSTLPNVHPPGVMAYLAVFWHVFGYSIAATRVAMLLFAALGALFTFLLGIELGRGTPGAPAFAALAFLVLSPLFFAQSMLAQLDMPAMCCTALALLLFLQNRFRASAAACVALVLIKETGMAAPALFGVWLLSERRMRQAVWYLLPLAALGFWLVILKRGTAHWLGNPGFAEYNLFYPLNPVRFAFALLRRIYYLFAGSGHFIGTAALVLAVRRMPVFRDRAWRVAAAFVAVHVLAVTVLGGAVLERYLLPAMPVVYIAFAISLRALPPVWRKGAAGALLACLIAASFINPVYPFPFENNLAFVSFVDLQREAAAAVEMREGSVATTFPMADALRRTEYGFTSRPRKVMEMTGFRPDDLARLRNHLPDMMIAYDTAWDPLHLESYRICQWLLRTYYDYQPPLTPGQIAQALSMRVARRWEEKGLSMSLLVRNAGRPDSDVKQVALLRGVNLGGKNLLPMKDLATMFGDAGCSGVRTYIQSGNIIFSAPGKLCESLPSLIAKRISERFGYRVPVILRTAAQLEETIANNPFLKTGTDDKTLHVYFLADVPSVQNIAKLDPDRSPPDRLFIRDRDIYVHLPNGMARTKLTNAWLDSKLGTISTARNWRTVLKLSELMRQA